MSCSIIGNSYWLDNTKILSQYPYLCDNTDCDIVVVGGGIVGALAAYNLQTSGINTILVDSSIIGLGSTAISSSICSYDIDFDLRELKKVISKDNAIKAYKACSDALEEISIIVDELGEDVGYSRSDSLYYTNKRENIEKFRDEFLLRRHNNLPVEFLDSINASEYFPFRIEAGIYAKNGAVTLDPYKFTQVLIKRAVDLGLRVFENTTIDTINSDFEGITLETNTRYKIQCEKVVNATNLSAIKEIRNFTQPKTTFTIVTEPVDDLSFWHNNSVIRDDSSPYTYLRILPDARILIGGLTTRMFRNPVTLKTIFNSKDAYNNKFHALRSKLYTLFPKYENLTVDYEFAGTTIDTGDGLPYIGVRRNYPNIYYDICCGYNGIAFAQIGADLIKDLYQGKENPYLEIFGFDRL